MRNSLGILVRVGCGLLALVFIAGLFEGPLLVANLQRIARWFNELGWMHAGLALIYLWIAGWALVTYNNAPSRTQRLLRVSIVIVTILVFISAIVGVLQPQLAGPLHHPVGTALGYLFSALFALAISIDAFSHGRHDNG